MAKVKVMLMTLRMAMEEVMTVAMGNPWRGFLALESSSWCQNRPGEEDRKAVAERESTTGGGAQRHGRAKGRGEEEQDGSSGD